MEKVPSLPGICRPGRHQMQSTSRKDLSEPDVKAAVIFWILFLAARFQTDTGVEIWGSASIIWSSSTTLVVPRRAETRQIQATDSGSPGGCLPSKVPGSCRGHTAWLPRYWRSVADRPCQARHLGDQDSCVVHHSISPRALDTQRAVVGPLKVRNPNLAWWSTTDKLDSMPIWFDLIEWMEGVLQQFAATVHRIAMSALACVASTLGTWLSSLSHFSIVPHVWTASIATTISTHKADLAADWLRLSAANQSCLSWQSSWAGDGAVHVSRHQ